ncbi:HEAT repeat domain-containing protein [Aetokthonos hydrillicola Thurmond2011]|jgi:bilin biosynthesis protein|uniref:HEAT repeat domain-containing protein n=2 Tax=Aetokthonos TaxID=1550243 RepID=A0AAP5M8W8_9CYAN|nr:HEAT repeat domain-containing protein [Aetokthonos hydrillicola]MBO3458031.1 HEAT repeat domain-containing protein [Aetokthonos hydrillicola CCALA 1050]MBW4587134.1 HEAT repeat domain-containing protein [Aetokthonos hydrillicola CCALA 1050]MDR9899616.1 HEAT repeat domain-containing protein [Aetokthonos hydrillicola Thurmond2011]
MTNQLEACSLSSEQVDEFLLIARQEVADQTFDDSDRQKLQLMVECLGDSRGMVRLGFADTLGKIGKPATPFLIEALLNHANPVVRRASAKTLTLIADPETVSPLVHALLHDEDTVVKGSAVGALARIGEASVPVLLEILASPEHPESTKGHAAWALAFIGTEAKAYLYREINSESESVRTAVVGAMAKIAQDSGEEEAFTVLMNALHDVSQTVRCEAAAVLGNLAYKPAVSRLVELLHNPEGETRKAAALSLMKINDKSAINPLQSALEIESEAGIQQIIKLAITNLQRESETEEW